MIAELEGAPQPGGYYKAMVDGHQTVVRVVTCSDMTVVCNPTEGPQRVIDRAAILGPADDPFPEEAAAGEVVTDYFVPRDQMPGVVRLPLTLESLSADELEELNRREAAVRDALTRGQRAAADLGAELEEIRAKKLYRVKHATIEAYMEAEFGISRQHGYGLMAHAKRFAALSARADIDILPESPRQTRALAAAGDQAAEVWIAAVTAAGGEQPTVKEVEAAVQQTTRQKEMETYGRATDDPVWWIEDVTNRLRSGVIAGFKDGNTAVVRPADGGGPETVFLFLDRLGQGEIPGKPAPFGICDHCREPNSSRDFCGACSRRLQGLVDGKKAEAAETAANSGHTLGAWTNNGASPLVMAAKCEGCGGWGLTLRQ